MSNILANLEPPGRTPEGHVIVRISKTDYEQAWTAGIRRMTENLNKADAVDYQRGRNIAEHLAQPLGVLCEVAVARHLNIDWDWDRAVWAAKDHHRYRNDADVGTNIEVRRIKYPNGAASLKANQVGKGLTLFVAYAMPPEFLNIKIVGASPYDRAWHLATPAVYNGVTSKTKRSAPQNTLLKCTCFYPGAKHACDPVPGWDGVNANTAA